jgi:AhpD family alkylhydroperoxidase
MKSRIDNPATIIPDVLPALMALGKTMRTGTLPVGTAALVHIRASQVNGCSFCLDMHVREAKKAGETDERLFAVGAWRDAPYFTEAERAALALTEAVTRLSDNPDPVPDAIWDEAARHYDEPALAALLLEIALINLWNRLNVPTRTVAGTWAG